MPLGTQMSTIYKKNDRYFTTSVTPKQTHVCYNLLPKLPKHKTLKRFCQAPPSHLKGFGAESYYPHQLIGLKKVFVN